MPSTLQTGRPISLIPKLLSMSTIALDHFYLLIKSLLLGIKCMFYHPKLHIFGPKKTNMSYFHPFEAAGHDSETQLQVHRKSKVYN